MGRIRVYIKPFANDEGTAFEASFTEISNDVLSTGLGSIGEKLDNSEYQVGVYQHTAFSMVLNNVSGYYSDVGQPYSIFKYRRNNSIVRVAWEYDSEPKMLGLNPAGSFKCSKLQILGDYLLDDSAFKSRAGDNNARFRCLGLTSLFDDVGSNYANIDNGDLYSEVIFKMLNVSAITDYLTVLQSNIVPAVDDTIDDKTLGDVQNRSGSAVLKKLLKYTNSVMYVDYDADTDTNIVYVSDKTPTASSAFTFYGTGSLNGQENVLDIPEARSGINRVKNVIIHEESGLTAEDATSIELNGRIEDQIEFAPTTDNGKIQAALNAFRTEYATRKIELQVEIRTNYDVLDLKRKDRVSFDFPVRFLVAGDNLLPLYGAAIYDDVDVYPKEVADIEIPAGTEFKIVGKDIELDEDVVTFHCIEV